MNIASLELCRELHELSRWEDPAAEGRSHVPGAPYYTLGYLLRKLPKTTAIMHSKDQWEAYFVSLGKKAQRLYADTPEDAACRLAIELFKQGVLTKEEKKE